MSVVGLHRDEMCLAATRCNCISTVIVIKTPTISALTSKHDQAAAVCTPMPYKEDRCGATLNQTFPSSLCDPRRCRCRLGGPGNYGKVALALWHCVRAIPNDGDLQRSQQRCPSSIMKNTKQITMVPPFQKLFSPGNPK